MGKDINSMNRGELMGYCKRLESQKSQLELDMHKIADARRSSERVLQKRESELSELRHEVGLLRGRGLVSRILNR